MNEFEGLQQIWDSQNKLVFAMNEEALHRRIESKKNKASRTTDISELLLIIVNIASGSLILAMNFSGKSASILMYIMAAWMMVTALYVLARRIQRMRQSKKFNRSILGDLDFAISVATYQVRLSQLMRLNVIPIGVISILGIIIGGKSILMAIGVLIFFALAYYLSGWEHSIYESRRRELEMLKSKLESE